MCVCLLRENKLLPAFKETKNIQSLIISIIPFPFILLSCFEWAFLIATNSSHILNKLRLLFLCCCLKEDLSAWYVDSFLVRVLINWQAGLMLMGLSLHLAPCGKYFLEEKL